MGAGLKAPDGTPIDEQIGSYVLRRYLTQGGMAALFLAHHVDAREVVVAKRVLPQFSRDLSFTRMFTREAQLASLLRHPNIIQVYDAGGLETEYCYFIMEYIHGVDLSHFLSLMRSRNLPLPLDHALTIVLGMCAGLHYAHDMVGTDGQPLEIVHRDVSPSNIMLSYAGDVKVMDFGVAKALALTSFTEAGTRKGKLSYMPPEQARADVLDRRADVFAIGAVLYELTTMRRLFTGSNELAVIHQLMYEERTRPSTVVPGYPAALEAIVLRAVEHKAADRYPTAAALADAVRGFAAQAGLSISTPALGALVREQISPPPHPGEDPDFFGASSVGAMPDAATAIEPVGPHDTSIEAFSDGGGLSTNAGSPPGTAAYPTTTAPYMASPPVAIAPTGSARPQSAGLSGGARVGIGLAALLTLAASGGVAFMLTRGDDGDEAADAAAASTAPSAAAPSETPSEAAVDAAKPTAPVATPPVATPPVAIPPVATPPPQVEEPVADVVDVVETPTTTDRSRKKKKKKKAATPSTTQPDAGSAAIPPTGPTTKKKKRNPTDTLLPIVPG